MVKVDPNVWNPFGPDGLWSTPAEVHLTIVAVAAAVLVAYLDWNRRRKLTIAAVFLALFAGLIPRVSVYKPWYFIVPFVAVWLAYLVAERWLRSVA